MDKNSFLIELSESDRTDFGRHNFSSQINEQRVFSAIWALESRVNSGGFKSFFENEDTALVAFVTKALQTIGATFCAEIVDRAVTLASVSRLDQIADELHSLDAEFYDYPDDLTNLLYNYVSSNQTTFGPVPRSV